MTRRQVFRIAALVLAFSCAVATPRATVTVPTELRALVADAELIVRGIVTDVRSTGGGRVPVETVGTVSVESVLKGEAGSVVHVRVPGGESGRTRTLVVGAPALREGAQAVFFLVRTPDGAWRPVGLSAGVAPVRLDSQSGRLVVQQPVLAGRHQSGPVVRGDRSRPLLRVAEYESLVRTVAAAGRRAAPRGGR